MLLTVLTATLPLASACTLTGPGPHQIDFGFRLDGAGNVIVAYPLCATNEIAGASVYVDVPGEGEDGNGFTTLWSATGPKTKEAKRGVFTVGTSADFAKETRPLKARLPEDGFYVSVKELSGGKQEDGRDHWVVPSLLKGKKPAADEWSTDKGKVLTRDEINSQAYCKE
ncbi:hypothetical protein ACH4TP_31040 [Streptomyces sp. NPDC021012]|uniref:hypothetical protein n=1 Tax=Streptomyces sp. NPDC021012 TaxID=3365107 RepID=UPI0037B63DCE